MPYCERCDRYFPNDHALDQHEQSSSRHWLCYKCNIDFPTEWGLTQHFVQSPRHAYCHRCDEHFNSANDLEDHYESAHWYCRPCNKIFDSDHGLHEHNRQKHHYCVQCKRVFQNANNLENHLRTHQARTTVCPGLNCGRAFRSWADLILHCESGTCPSGVTRRKLTELMVRVDKGHIITDPRRLIEQPNGSYAPRGGNVENQWATAESWNGRAFECVLCHREFAKLPSLNAHLQSPAHADKVFKCPSVYNGCAQTFGTLSALVQHVEGGRCGVQKFGKQIQGLLRGATSGMRALTAY